MDTPQRDTGLLDQLGQYDSPTETCEQSQIRHYPGPANAQALPNGRPAPAAQGINNQRQTASEPIVQIGPTLYKVTHVIAPPSESDTAMSDGVRVIKDRRGSVFVEKRLKMSNGRRKERAEAEMNALNQLKQAGGSPNVNHLHAAFYVNGSTHGTLVLEYCDSGTLLDYMGHKKHGGTWIDERFCWHVFSQLGSALAMCHSGIRDPLATHDTVEGWNTLCHLDIKPSNVFLDSKQGSGSQRSAWPRVVLGDFGCAVTKTDFQSGCERLRCGTYGWFPPEESTPNPRRRGLVACGRHTDIWQLGGVLQVMCGLLEIPEINLVEQDRPCGTRYSSQLNRAVATCMDPSPDRRPTAVDVVRKVKGFN